MSAQPTFTPSESITVPEGFTLHAENTTHILLPANNEAFLNPVQEFNRDLSIACIRVWSEIVDDEKLRSSLAKKQKQREGSEKRKEKKLRSDTNTNVHDDSTPVAEGKEQDVAMKLEADAAETAQTEIGPLDGEGKQTEHKPYEFVLLEALSATGLRAIRYAKEIPLVKYVIANDLSPSAVEAIRQNVELNGLGPQDSQHATDAQAEESVSMSNDGTIKEQSRSKKRQRAKVVINEGDACALMYSHRQDPKRVDCVDLDPYGTAAPFVDAAVQCVKDGGLLCVTCTDLAVLASNTYPEKCFSNYGGVSLKAEYSHEAALRLVLHTISTSAARYGRYIEPLLSLSIDFYVRLFVRVRSGPAEVKKAASKTSTFYVCSSCQAFYEQPLGKIVEKISDKTGQVNLLYRQRQGPPVGDMCPECNSALHVAGPMWSAPIHDPDFVGKVLEHVEGNTGKYGTSVRMKGMLTVAKEELSSPFYFTPSRVAGFFHCISPSLEEVASALLNEGFSISRSHALAGSLKTTATRQDVHDVFKAWVQEHPVKPERISTNSSTQFLHAKEARFKANFEHHPQSVTQSSKVKLVRYQHNPTPNWGPGTKAKSKRKRDDEDHDV